MEPRLGKKMFVLLLAALAASAIGCGSLPPGEGGSDPPADGGNYHENEKITRDTVWKASANPHVVVGTVWVGSAEGAALFIEPGAVVRFDPGAQLAIGWEDDGHELGENPQGALIAPGTALQPILFTSNAAEPAKGDWGGLIFGPGTLEKTELSGCTIEYAGNASAELVTGSARRAAVYAIGDDARARPALSLRYCTVRHSADYGLILADGGHFSARSAGLTVTDCDNHLIRIMPKWMGTVPDGTYEPAGGKGIEIFSFSPQWDVVGDPAVNWEVTLEDYCDYYVENHISVYNHARLVINGGVTVIMEDPVAGATEACDLRIWIGGRDYQGEQWGDGMLYAKGAAENPIIFRAAVDGEPGRWGGIYFYPCGGASVMQYAVVSGAGVDYGQEELGNATVLCDSGNQAGPDITHCTFMDALHYGVRCYNMDPEADYDAGDRSNQFIDCPVWCHSSDYDPHRLAR